MKFQKGNKSGRKFKKGHISVLKGKTRVFTEEHKAKLKVSNHHTGRDYCGEKNPCWRGGRSTLVQRIRTCFEYRQWRSDVYQRDNFTCTECGNNKSGNLNADHITSFVTIMEKYNITTMEQALECDELWNINNGRTLCIECHRKTDTYGNRKKKK